jgi:putative peptide zinc metalloprotease protein
MDSTEHSSMGHHSTVELSNCKLHLRSDLSFHLQEYQGAACYLIEDEFNSRFFRVGLAEYHLISLLDGSTTISHAISKTAVEMGDQAIPEQDAITICKWLIDCGLATTDASRTSGRMVESFEKSDRKKRLAQINPVTPRFPLFNPDRALTQLSNLMGWLFSIPMFLLWCGFVGTAIYQVSANWDMITRSQSVVLSRDNWIWLVLTWMLLKVLHETAHGIACKRFGGDVRQCGIVLIVMIPLPFVDVTSSWRFPSKWQKIYVAAAGMYVEIFLAAVAAIIWSHSELGPVRQHAFNFMLAGSITTLLFNANPLMRFDGYYILSDWLEMPNLGSHGQQWMKWVGKKFYLGLDVDQPSWPEGRGWIVAIYAILALFWRILICAGLAIAAESLFFGAGVVLASFAIVLWAVWPIGKLLRMVFIGEATRQRPSRIRFCLLTSMLGFACWGICTEVPWYARVKAPAIVDFQESHEVRTPVGGFLDEIFVCNSQFVRRGELLARLENRDIKTDVEQLQIELASNELRMRQLREREQMAAYDVESKNRDALKTKLDEKSEQQMELEVRASADGIVVADELDSQLGTHFAPGQKLCTIESESRKEIVAMVSQRDYELFKHRVGQPVEVHLWGNGQGYLPARLNQLNPRGRVDLPHPAFGAASGGPLPVKYRTPSVETEDSNQDPMELIDPRFLARVELSQVDSQRIRSGQPGFVSFRTSRGSIGEVISEKISVWIRNMRKLNQASF